MNSLDNSAIPKKGWSPQVDRSEAEREWESRGFISRWMELTFLCPQKFTQYELLYMCLNNFMQNLPTTLMAQTSEDFNELFSIAKPMTWKSTSRKHKDAKESGRTGIQKQRSWHPKKKPPMLSDCPHPKRLFSGHRKALHQWSLRSRIKLNKWDDKRPSLRERQ